MANIDEIIKKSQARLEKHGLQKKIQRTGPKRPWQEGLQVEVSVKPPHEEAINEKKEAIASSDFKVPSFQISTEKPPLKATELPVVNADQSPASDTVFFKIDDLKEDLKNIQQTCNKPTSEPTTVVQHTYNKSTSQSTTNIQQTCNIKDETYNKLTSEPTTVVQHKSTTVVQQNLLHKVQQTYNKPTSTLFSSGVNRLSGQRLKALTYLFDMCVSNGSRLSGPLSVEALLQAIECSSVKTAQTVIYRLEKDGYVIRAEYKAGRGGWTSYEIPQDIYNQMVQYTSKPTTNLLHNIQQTYNKSTSQLTSQPTSNLSSKVDSKNINNLTNYLERAPATPTWFKDLDFSKVQPIGPMMVNSSIRTLVQQKLDPEVVQDFINRFTSWAATQSKISNLVGLFCDKLKELANEGDSAILSCMTEEERQVEVAFAVHVEKARAEMELIQKARSENQEKLKESEFEKWYNSSSEDEKLNLAEPNAFASSGTEAYKRILKVAYFEKMQLE